MGNVLSAAVRLSLAALVPSVPLPLGDRPSATRVEEVREARFVPIGGIQQWITITGSDRRNPVVLFLHGGPGDAYSPYAASMFEGWDKDFTLVQWDQRGAGRTYGAKSPPDETALTLERMVQDGLEVTQFLMKHLQKRKIILVGGSWGSLLGINMVHARPDLFRAYVGVAQLVNWQANLLASYERVLSLARSAGDPQATEALTALGPPPWASITKWPIFRRWRRAYEEKRATAARAREALDPAYSSTQERAQYAAADDFSFLHFVGLQMSGPINRIDLPALGTDFSIPILVVQGEEDLVAVPELAEAYVDRIRAPRKEFHRVPGTGHEPSAAEWDLTRALLLDLTRSPEPD